jgi:pilus assembly protein FimV
MRAFATVFHLSLAAALCIAAAPAKALGFGRIGNTTQLGQPLNFAALIRLEGDETLSRECVAAEVFVGDNKLQPSQVRVTLEAASAANERLLRVTTLTIVDEPVVTVSVSVGCTSKVTRKFVAFIDPPLINAPQTAAADSSLMVPQRADSQVAPLVAIVEGEQAPVAVPSRSPARPLRSERPRRDAASARATPRSRPVVVARADAANAPSAPTPAAPKKAAATARAAQAPRTAAVGPRLELEAAPAVVARAASAPPAGELPVVAAAASAASAPLTDDAAALLALERERIRLLEEGLARLRSDSQATQQALVALQARLQAAESERYANPLVYTLAWLLALLALAVGALWWRQSRARTAAQWWAPPAPAAAARVDRAKPHELETAMPTTMSGVAPAYEVSMLGPGEVSNLAPDLPMTIPAAAALRPIVQATAEPTRELSVEELIDLEQQAEFFVVLGQDEAAIELLMSHVRNDGGVSPLPYLKLLEIYKRRGEADAYSRIRDRFNRRFNAYAPDWDADLQHGLPLEAYRETVEKLQELWVSPAKAMETLAGALFRRDPSDQTYDLPAYRELLFLYAIARDFQEHGLIDLGRDVDLLLPMHDDAPLAPIAHLVSSVPAGFQNSTLSTQPLDLDVSLVRGDADHAAPKPAPAGVERRAAERGSEAGPGLIDFDLGLDPPAPVSPGSA